MQRLIIITFVAALVAAFFGFGLNDYLTLEQLKNSQAQFDHWLTELPVLVPAVYFIIYVVVTALSLPGAAIMTLAGGALFGLGQGLLLVSFASSVGATLAFLVSRFVLRDSVQKRFGERLKTINRGIEHDGAFYLFTLRLVPLFPFFVINLVMGVTRLKTWTFYWVSQVGMLGGTAVYVNAGTQLADIDSVSGIFSLELILSFALLGIFPWIAKGIVRMVQRRRAYKGWSKPRQFDRNLVVIGGGAGGLVSSYIAATVKAKVTLVEAHKMGGDCLNYGCVPSKALIKSAKVAHQMRHADHYGLNAQQPTFSFRTVMERIHKVIKEVEPHDSVERYTGLGVDVVQGYATIVDPWTVDIALNDGGTQRLTTRSIVIAAGAEPLVPELPGLDDVGYVTSDTLWDTFAKLDEPPKRLIVLGGGPIGSELSHAFARLGSKVSQIERGERILAKEDDEVSDIAREAMMADGVEVLTRHEALRCERDGGEKVLVVKHQGEEKRIPFDQVLVAVGRKARLTGYGLEQLGIRTERTVVTNEYLETLYPNIYAAGDVAGPYQFTHTAAHMAWYAAVNALFGQFKRFKVDYSVIPWTTFLDPEIARVGISEADAKAQEIDYEVTRFELAELDRAIADSTTTGFIKVLTPKGKDKILGVVIVGTEASNLMAEFILAMRHGLGLNKILGTIHTYPTLAEANKYTAGEWKKAHKPEAVLKWLEKFHTWRRGGDR
ncbi:pyruvate/2-oxoglutarate dehydrogenase complex dihydrolipoamide dehydrogenase (E3) component [Marinimicrobium koreense]|uniref:Pyruvate/2-oxoglutarate dehydrogenase complex dihydrolipoamide dehydrogenase (E3) component n=1 Tax=Marinimicrobium koreense TaxID=306545 RepID=A0A3N1P039_9GAMM|nr:bifunctional TVP38/TMEM64 family protein/FAD-dependent oxidoreductase [Marinimicrobium koreense]ROQ21409.1 pyruvate/2-oxoglutarate dehydrogenase complex dihydrolipoamide dehydrogenase (E3) component [Marinimicrobium koreense]